MELSSRPVAPERLLSVTSNPIDNTRKKIIYRMQASVRISDNVALAEAIRLSVQTGKPLKVVFHLNDAFPDANYRHFVFLADALREVMTQLQRMGISFELLTGDFNQAMKELDKEAACMVTDKGYLRIQREQLAWLTQNLSCPLIVAEDNLTVPIASASFKAEWAARTLRPKVMEKLPYFIHSPFDLPSSEASKPEDEKNSVLLDRFLEGVKLRLYLAPVAARGGETQALALLDNFINEKLSRYDTDRNHPELQATSRLSAYLHFGMISPITICRRCMDIPEAESFIEQLVVRRELAHNYIYYTPDYDRYESMPEWARRTLQEHISDKRPYLYKIETLQNAATHDECWNAAMREMIQTGYMENTMRMYWGKKIIEWSESPQEAYATMLTLNNRYFLDGRDANSFTGVGWCFGLHDRPWQERQVFGMVRYMNEAGLRRKYAMDKYISKF